jgi:hypothetical protein
MFGNKKKTSLMNFNKFRRNDNNLVYLFTNARDEPNIAEWIAHHLLLGFDKVFVFDHLSVEPIQNMVGTNFDNRLVVISVEGGGNIKIKLMNDAVNIAKRDNASWMLYLDADEFLVLNKINNIKKFLGIFKNADAIGVNWLMFGTSGYIKQPEGLITDNFTRSQIRLNPHVKSFVRPSTVQQISNPHFFIISQPRRYFSANGTWMPQGPFNRQPLPFFRSLAYVAHYFTQSEEEHIRRKGRPADDGTGTRTTDNIHKKYNNIPNNQVKYKYSQNIKNFLQSYNIFL